MALVDGTPGLTRDRREGVLKNEELLGVPIRFVDTAGFESLADLDDGRLSLRNLNRQLVTEMLK